MDIYEQKQLVANLVQSSRFIEAKDLCTRLCEKNANDAEAWLMLGVINGELSDFQEAELCCRNAVTLSPENIAIHFNLAVALTKQKKIKESIEVLNKCLELQPDYIDAHRELAAIHMINGDLVSAVKYLKNTIELDPDSAISHFNLGKSLQSLGREIESIIYYENTIKLKPDFHNAYVELGSIFLLNFNYDKAITILENGINHFPASEALHFRLANAYQNQGDADIALQHYERVLVINKDHVDAKTGAAAMLGRQGKYEVARGYLNEVMKSYPDNISAITTYADFATILGETDRAMEIVAEKLDTGQYSDRMYSSLHFSIAKLYESMDDYDRAFSHYKSGNKLRNADFNYISHEQMFACIMQTFSRENMEKLPHSDNKSEAPVFIVGVPRSGSSLTEQILSSHPDVFGAGELRNINYAATRLPGLLNTENLYPLCVEKITTSVLNMLADEYLQDLSERSDGSPYTIDKMPFNFIHMGLINLIFPNARIIHCLRNPIDTCLSCYFKNFAGEHPYAFDLSTLGQYYRIYQRVMSHWKRTLSLPILDVKYEDMVADQEHETRRILEFCNLEWDEACLQFHKTDRTVATASHDQVRQPLYTKSIERWRHYEKHLDPLFDSLNLRKQ